MGIFVGRAHNCSDIQTYLVLTKPELADRAVNGVEIDENKKELELPSNRNLTIYHFLRQ